MGCKRHCVMQFADLQAANMHWNWCNYAAANLQPAFPNTSYFGSGSIQNMHGSGN